MDDFLKKSQCDRCQGPLTMRTLSVMNNDVICMKCKDEEREHPKFKEASEREHSEVVKGNKTYEGLFAGQTYPFD